jgi:V8-like Glu-specific endopeptidase
MRRIVVLGVLVLLLSGVSATPARAITFGQVDGTLHPWVGALVVETSPGVKDWICSGTLVAPNVFLTAAHCLAGSGIPAHDVWVTFDPAFSPTGRFFRGTYTVDPLYGSTPSSDYHDLAVVVLDRSPHISPATLPAVGLLDVVGVRDQSFTAVGYGQVRDAKTGGPHTGYYDGIRRYVSQSFQSLTSTTVTFSMNPATGDGGTCYGDSGGPHFVGDTTVLVAVTITGDMYCRSTDKDYRIDTPDSLAFIRSFITR